MDIEGAKNVKVNLSSPSRLYSTLQWVAPSGDVLYYQLVINSYEYDTEAGRWWATRTLSIDPFWGSDHYFLDLYYLDQHVMRFSLTVIAWMATYILVAVGVAGSLIIVILVIRRIRK